jgi:conjugal transfer ATP-binding protein TraC
MRNNLMDTVAQAVNSLVSALQLPDESAKANDTLGSMNFPSSAGFYPIRIMILKGLFINTKTIGFMLEARPLPGQTRILSAHWSICCGQNPSWRAVHY